MDRSEAANVSVAGILLGVGGVMLSIVFPLAAAVKPHGLTTWWFLLLSSLGGLLAVIGGYMVVAVYAGSWLPPTASERRFRPNLTNPSAEVLSAQGNYVVLQIAATNTGRDKLLAYLNVIVPEFVSEMRRCTPEGAVGRPEHKGVFWRLSEHFWNGDEDYPGGMPRLLFFRLTMPALRDFSVRLKIFSAQLKESPFEATFDVRLPTPQPALSEVPEKDGRGW